MILSRKTDRYEYHHYDIWWDPIHGILNNQTDIYEWCRWIISGQCMAINRETKQGNVICDQSRECTSTTVKLLLGFNLFRWIA